MFNASLVMETIYQRQLQISEDRVDLALSDGLESSEVNKNEGEVETVTPRMWRRSQSMTQVQTKTRNQKMEIQAFLNLTDGPLSY